MKWAAPFFIVAVVVLAVLQRPSTATAKPDQIRYLSPGELAISNNGARLYVVCERSDEVLVVDTRSGSVLKRIAVGHLPRGIAISADGRQIYVADSWIDKVSVIDAEKLEIVGTVAAGFEPTGVVSDRVGKTLYVANRLSNDISVIDLPSGNEIKRLAAGRGASYLTISADGSLIYCTHVYPKLNAFRSPPESEITVIDTRTQRVVERKTLGNVAGVFHIAMSTDGELGVAAQLRPKNLIPLAHVEHGWAFGNSLAVFGKGIDGTVQVPLDELDRYFAMPYGVAITPDKAKVYVSTGGSDSITAIDLRRLLSFIAAKRGTFANDLSASANYVQKRIPVGRNPRAIVLSPDGKRLYVANRMDDTLGVIDTARDKLISIWDLGG